MTLVQKTIHIICQFIGRMTLSLILLETISEQYLQQRILAIYILTILYYLHQYIGMLNHNVQWLVLIPQRWQKITQMILSQLKLHIIQPNLAKHTHKLVSTTLNGLLRKHFVQNITMDQMMMVMEKFTLWLMFKTSRVCSIKLMFMLTDINQSQLPINLRSETNVKIKRSSKSQQFTLMLTSFNTYGQIQPIQQKQQCNYHTPLSSTMDVTLVVNSFMIIIFLMQNSKTLLLIWLDK